MNETVFRIDTHQHIVPEVYKSALERIGVHGSGNNPWPKWRVSRTLEVMDRQGIAASVTAISSPGVYFGDVPFAVRLARECNEYSAKLLSEHGARFGALAVMPLPDVQAALKELAYALDTLKLDGISLLTHVGESYLGQPGFEEFYAELDRRHAVVFVHPVRPPSQGMPKYGFPDAVVELNTDTTRAIANVLYQGIPERFPGIRFIFSHAGGTVPMLLYRLRNMLTLPAVAERMPKGLDAYLKKFYYDVAQSCTPTALRALQDIADPSRILLGSDYPLQRFAEGAIADVIRGLASYGQFDAAQRRRVERDNALALFPRFGN
jgi:predicted TIM-barrel fold metal-dependent hydrolase